MTQIIPVDSVIQIVPRSDSDPELVFRLRDEIFDEFAKKIASAYSTYLSALSASSNQTYSEGFLTEGGVGHNVLQEITDLMTRAANEIQALRISGSTASTSEIGNDWTALANSLA